MWGQLPGSARCWRYLLGHPSAVLHSLSVHGQVCCQAAFRGLILDRVFLTSAADRQSAWSLGGVGSFCAGVSFCVQTVNKSGWVYRGGMDHHHRPVAGACSQWWSEWLATGSVCLCCPWSDCWFFEHMTVLHFWCHRTDWPLLFWGLLYLLIWMLHLWSLAAHEPLLSSIYIYIGGFKYPIIYAMLVGWNLGTQPRSASHQKET